MFLLLLMKMGVREKLVGWLVDYRYVQHGANRVYNETFFNKEVLDLGSSKIDGFIEAVTTHHVPIASSSSPFAWKGSNVDTQR